MMKAVIFDLDNTLLYQTNRHPYDWSDLSGDVVIPEMKSLISTFISQHYHILIVTGRPESCRINTENWLRDNSIFYDELIMKDGNPYEKSFVFKQKALDKIVKKYKVEFVFDDDQKCVDMYVKNNIITFQPQNYKL